MTVRKLDLGALSPIAEGAVGKVFRVGGSPLPGVRIPLAYKEVKPVGDLSVKERHRVLRSMSDAVAFRARLTAKDAADLDKYTTWPLDSVEDGGTPCGILMPLIPPQFFITSHAPGQPPEQIVFDLSWMSARDTVAARAGVDRSRLTDPSIRLALLAQMVYAVGRLHKRGLVYGDISLKNAAIAVDLLQLKLLDCDAVAQASDLRRNQLHSPFFQPPEIASGRQKLQDSRTDVYKLALCVIRGLSQGAGVTQAKDPRHLQNIVGLAGVALLQRAVGDDPARRPTARELFQCLERLIQARSAPPALQSAGLHRGRVFRGQDVQVDWQATGATRITVRTSGVLLRAVPTQGRTAGRLPVTPHHTGDITVTAENVNGENSLFAGRVEVLEMPPLHIEAIRLPTTSVPALPRLDLDPVIGVVPDPPEISLPPLILPALTWAAERLLDLPRPAVDLTLSMPVAGASGSLSARPVGTSGGDLAAAALATAWETVTAALTRYDEEVRQETMNWKVTP